MTKIYTMSAEKPFNPATHREEYAKTEKEIAQAKANISGDKTSEEIALLVAERDRLVADLGRQKDAAHGQALKDDANLDDACQQIQKLTAEIEGYRAQIEEITGKKMSAEQETPNLASLQSSNRPFLLDTFTQWHDKAAAKKATQEARFENPATIDYESLSRDIDEKRFGEYTLNPDTQSIDFEQAKPIIIDLPQFVGKPRHEVMKYIIDTYGSTHHIPGIEYWKWLIENPDKAPQELKDGNWHYFPGSVLRVKGGRWHVPSADWRGAKFARDAGWLGNGWNAGERVVLLEK